MLFQRPIQKNASFDTFSSQELVIRKLHNLRDIEPIWREIIKHQNKKLYSHSWSWISAWVEEYGATIPYFFVVGYDNDTPIGITLVSEKNVSVGPLSMRTLCIGTTGEQYQEWITAGSRGFVVLPVYESDYLRACCKYITSLSGWDQIEIASPIASQMHHFLSHVSRKYRIIVLHEPCSLMDLSAAHNSHASVVSSLSKDTAYAIRRTIKAFPGEIIGQVACTVDEVLEMLRELETLHQTCWKVKGSSGTFARKKFRNFLYTVIPSLFEEGHIMLYRVRDSSLGTIGSLCLFIDNGHAYGVLSGFRTLHQKEFSQVNINRIKYGLLVHSMCMQECMHRGFHTYDFGTGAYEYKQQLMNNSRMQTTVSIRRNYMPDVRDVYLESRSRMESMQLKKIIKDALART